MVGPYNFNTGSEKGDKLDIIFLAYFAETALWEGRQNTKNVLIINYTKEHSGKKLSQILIKKALPFMIIIDYMFLYK